MNLNNKEEAIDFLKVVQKQSRGVQFDKKHKINEAFDTFCETEPSLEEFKEQMKGIIVTPHMLYRMSDMGESDE